ncbi:MAG: hybrid sensor histidine kinase/response regulator [Solirubrobacteraceae bacterium]
MSGGTDRRPAWWASLAAALVALIGLVVLAGWVIGIGRLESFTPALGKTTSDTAVGLLLLGVAGVLHSTGTRRRRTAVGGIGALVAAIGALALIEYATGARLGIDRLLPHGVAGAGAPADAGRMTVEAAVGLTFAGAALAAWSLRPSRSGLVELGALVLGVIALLALTRLALGRPGTSRGRLSEDLEPPSIQTAIAFALLACSMLLIDPRERLIGLSRRRGAGGVLLRRLVLAVIVLPALLAWAELEGQRQGAFEDVAGLALYATALTVVFGWLVWQSARTLDRYEQNLRLAERRWSAIFEADRSGVAIRGIDAQLLDCNMRFADIFGLEREQMIGTYPADIMTPQDAELAMASYPDAWGTGGSGLEVERAVTRRDGRKLRLRVNVFTVSSEDGEPLYQVVLTDDLTERRRLEEELAHTRRIESIGRLAGGVAHELNNKLAVILGFTDLVADELGPGHPQQSSLDEVRAAAEHSAALTHDLLSLGRRQAVERRPLNVSEVLASIARILRPALGEQVSLEVQDGSGGALVLADRTQLEQVLVNLALNARDAMPDGGQLTIRTAVLAPESAADRRRRVQIAVSDTGIGMDKAVRERIFEPFFTTKEFGSGAGLGLATALGIVVQGGGRIDVESAPGAGTTVLVELPEVLPAEAVAGGRDDTPDGKLALRVLLVEDEEQVRRLVGLLLHDAGYRVLSVSGGNEALQVLHEGATEIDVLLTDMVLTDIHGGELAQRARELRPGLPIVYMSGYEHEPDAVPSADGILSKPFTEQQLAAALHDALKP